MIPTPAQYAYLALIRQVIASWNTLAWVKPSWIMAEVAIESGFDPLVVNATGRQDGLLQVIPGTVAEVVREYALGSIGPQTDPLTSLEVGTLYFNTCARRLLAAGHHAPPPAPPGSLYLVEVAQAYNRGWAGFLAGERNQRYGGKMLAQQEKWAFVDSQTLVTM